MVDKLKANLDLRGTGGLKNLDSETCVDYGMTRFVIENHPMNDDPNLCIRKYRASCDIRCIEKDENNNDYLKYDKMIETHEIVQNESGGKTTKWWLVHCKRNNTKIYFLYTYDEFSPNHVNERSRPNHVHLSFISIPKYKCLKISSERKLFELTINVEPITNSATPCTNNFFRMFKR